MDILGLHPPETIQERTCNCIVKNECPLNGNCLSQNIIYQATVSLTEPNLEPNFEPKIYIGSTATTFKKRYSNHKKTFNHEKYEHESELSKEIWRLKHKNITPKITWKIVNKCTPFNRTTLKCNLCLSEKLEIAIRNDKNMLNKKSELISKCRHINQHCMNYHDPARWRQIFEVK